MAVNVSSQPAPQAGALLRLQWLETDGQNQSASVGAAQCWFGEKQDDGRAIGLSCCWTVKEGGMSHGRQLCCLLKQGPVTHKFCLGHSHIGSVAAGAVPICRGLNTWAETSFLLPPAQEQPLPGLEWAPEVTNPTKAQGEQGFAPAQEVLHSCSWKQRMSRALQSTQ